MKNIFLLIFTDGLSLSLIKKYAKTYDRIIIRTVDGEESIIAVLHHQASQLKPVKLSPLQQEKWASSPHGNKFSCQLNFHPITPTPVHQSLLGAVRERMLLSPAIANNVCVWAQTNIVSVLSDYIAPQSGCERTTSWTFSRWLTSAWVNAQRDPTAVPLFLIYRNSSGTGTGTFWSSYTGSNKSTPHPLPDR